MKLGFNYTNILFVAILHPICGSQLSTMALDPEFRDRFFYVLGMFLTHLFASGNNLMW